MERLMFWRLMDSSCQYVTH